MKTAKEELKTTAPARSRVTISMRAVRHTDKDYAVEMMVTGLVNEREAKAAMNNLQKLLCGSEITTN